MIERAERVGYVNVLCTYKESQQSYAKADNLMQYAVEHLILTQMGMNVGIKAFGQLGVDAVLREMKQFHDRDSGTDTTIKDN